MQHSRQQCSYKICCCVALTTVTIRLLLKLRITTFKQLNDVNLQEFRLTINIEEQRKFENIIILLRLRKNKATVILKTGCFDNIDSVVIISRVSKAVQNVQRNVQF